MSKNYCVIFGQIICSVSALLSSEFSTISHGPSYRVRKRQQTLQLQCNASAAQITEYENRIEGLQQQLSEVQAANVQAHIQLNVATFQLNSAADPSVNAHFKMLNESVQDAANETFQLKKAP